MKSTVFTSMILTLLTLPVHAQYSCSPVERNGFTGGSVSFYTNQGINNTIQLGINYWSVCGSTGALPSFSVNNFNADLVIPVVWHGEEGPKCGMTNWGVLAVGGPEKPYSIDLYAQARNADGVLASCNPIEDALAHEIGHVLGLADAPNPATTCRGEIMGGRASGETRSVLSSDCATADANWYTPIEYARDNPPPPPPPEDRPRDNPGSEVHNDGCGDDCSPIIINFEQGAYRLTGANAPVRFAMNANHEPTLMGWTEAGADEAFLWLDRNQNGKVTSGAELFGNFTRLRSGAFAKNGFEALQEFDDNHDGVIDSHDPIWSQLMLWRDVNHNAISEPSEITPLADSAVIAIDLHYHWTGKHDGWGNTWRYESLVTIWNAGEHGARKQPVYDIFFASVVK